MGTYSTDANNREQLLEYAVQTGTAPDGTKMGAEASPSSQAPGGSLPVHVSVQGAYNGAVVEAVRSANVFKFISVSAIAVGAPSTIWTPAAGKKVRLMGFVIAASAGGSHILRMGAAGSGTTVIPLALTANLSLFVDIGQGKLASAANDVLEIFNNAASSSYWITAWGTEE